MELEDFNNIDAFSTDFDVQLSQIVMKIFWLGYLAGKQQLADDYESTDKPLYMAVKDLQDQVVNLQGQQESQEEVTLVPPSELEKKERIYGKAITNNQKRLNKQHDVIVKQMLDNLEQEMKQAAGNILSQTKHRAVKK